MAGGRLPLAMFRCGIRAGHGPEHGQSPEMIKPEQVHQLTLSADALPPPAEPCQPVAPPAIHRGSPELPGLGEVIGRNTALGAEAAIPVDGEQLPMAPDIRAVRTDIEGQISKQQDAELSGLRTDALPLAVELPLGEPFPLESILMLRCPVLKGLALVLSQRTRPVPPGLLMLIVEDAITHMVLQPTLLAAPLLEGLLTRFILLSPGLEQGLR